MHESSHIFWAMTFWKQNIFFRGGARGELLMLLCIVNDSAKRCWLDLGCPRSPWLRGYLPASRPVYNSQALYAVGYSIELDTSKSKTETDRPTWWRCIDTERLEQCNLWIFQEVRRSSWRNSRSLYTPSTNDRFSPPGNMFYEEY